ncbi:hypothetical protein [Hymenobacter sp.]|uniref:hypothetical protein n=1 Tax=Hymenobacter sp. TaxID=1898978 RepID=UPI00286AEBDD|nr:hypothetical protein [Hymenobacter sp.]
MKNLLLFCVAATFAFVLASCEQAQEAKNAYSAVVTTAKAAEEIGKNMEAAQSRQVTRRKQGDTLALNYKELQKYLPASPAGFAAEGTPEGQSTNMAGMHMATSSQEYKKGDQSLEVTLVDYNGAGALFMGATAMMSSGMEIEDDNQLMRGIKTKQAGVKGMETFDKKDHKATVMLAVGDRFLLTVEATGQNDTELVKSVATGMNLEALAKR